MLIPTRKQIIKEVKYRGDKIAAVLPFHYPRALLRAHNIFPVEIWGPPNVDDMTGNQHFPEYTCKIVQKATRFLMGPGADPVDCILMPHTCDSLQGMASVMTDFLSPPQPIFTIYHPRGRRQSDSDFLTAELKYLSEKLSDFSGVSPTDDEINLAIDLESEAEIVFKQISENRENYNISDRDFYTFLRSREYLPAETFTLLARDLPKGTANLKGPALMISGIVAEPLSLFDNINDFGAHVITDDLACVSRRNYKTKNMADPFGRLTYQMLSMPPDSTISTPFKERFNHIISQMKRKNVRGLLVFDVKFCEPELFYLPLLEEAIRKEGFGFLYLETELTPTIPQATLNRINSFIEVIS